MNTQKTIELIKNGSLDGALTRLYGGGAVEDQRERYIKAIDEFCALYGADRDISIFSVSGRSEVSGNHTDHNRGCVIAASVDLDVVAVASRSEGSVINIKSEGFRADTVDICAFTKSDPALFGSSGAIIAGVADGFEKNGLSVGAFDAYTTSSVPGGAGLSSSAAFENTVGTILNHFYNGGAVSPVTIAKISQYAENVFFGKPCGLMDQVACAVGGIVAIDFEDPQEPVIEKLDFDLSAAGYALCIVKTGGNHADLTDDYAAIPAEMKSVAKALGCEYLRETSKAALLSSIVDLRGTVGDRAILRAAHFFDENERVASLKKAIKNGDAGAFLGTILASGRSSFCYLQNVYTNKNVSEQGVSLALSLAESYLSGVGGAWRVHGGGFAGTVQCFVPFSALDGFRALVEGVFGEGSCLCLSIRPDGAVKLL
jgi:galactokinase